jgi:glycosyltransferase involved in cell wall biosynthesis
MERGNIAMFLDQDFPPDIRVEKEIKTLQEAGYEVNLFVLAYHKRIKFEEVRGIKIYRNFENLFLYKLSALAYTFPLFHYLVRRKIQWSVKEHKPDFLHVHDMVIAPSVLAVGKKYHIPTILDLHENRPAIMELYKHVNKFPGNLLIDLNAWKKAQLKIQQQADRVILITEEAKRYASEKEGVEPSKIFVLPNTVKKNFEKELVSSPEIESRFNDKFCILYFGDTALRRGTDTIIDAVFMLKSRIENIHAIIVGKGSEDAVIKEQAERLNVSDSISFEGWQDVKLLKAYAQSSAIGLCPFKRNLHHDTTFANKLFQFMGLGLPVIVSDCPSQVNIIKKYDCGLVFKAEDEHDLAEKIVMLYQDINLAKKLGQNGKKCIEIDLNWERTSESLIHLYDSLIHN